MNKKRLFLYLPLLLALMLGSTGCSSDDEEKDNIPETVFFFKGDVPVKVLPYDKMPEKVAQAANSGFYSTIFQGYYDNKPIYCLVTPFNSSFQPEFYDSNGNAITFSDYYEMMDFMELAHDWICIYYNETLNGTA